MPSMQLPVACSSLLGVEFISLASLIYKRQAACQVIGSSHYRGNLAVSYSSAEVVSSSMPLVPHGLSPQTNSIWSPFGAVRMLWFTRDHIVC